jgi:hypothetical protein
LLENQPKSDANGFSHRQIEDAIFAFVTSGSMPEDFRAKQVGF